MFFTMNLSWPFVVVIVGIVLFHSTNYGSVLANDDHFGYDDDDPNTDEDNHQDIEEKRYSYEDIVEEIDKVTNEFLEQTIRMRNLATLNDVSTEFEPMRRRRRSVDDINVPEFIRDGIKLTQRITRVEEQICANKGHIIDFDVTRFNGQDYFTCLIKSKNDNVTFELYYGSPPFVENSIELKTLSKPTRLFAFTTKKVGHEVLIAVVLNQNINPSEVSFVWHRIEPDNQILYQNNIKDIGKINQHTSAVWPSDDMVVLHDVQNGLLRIYEYFDSYFDQEIELATYGRDLSALCAFSYSRTRYLVIGYRKLDPKSFDHKDVVVLRFDRARSIFHKVQSIQSVEDVIDIKYFSIGYGTHQESFLTIVEKEFIIFYKFLKSKHEFIIFQRIESHGVRQVIPYGDSQRTFLMALVAENYDIYLVNYNSLRFIYSRVSNQLRAIPNQPIKIYQKVSDSGSAIRMLIGKQSSIEIQDVGFYHDKNLMTLWTEHLNWCTQKRNEVIGLERSTNLVSKKFSEAYQSNDPLVIRGTLSVPGYIGEVEAKDYRQRIGSPSQTAIVLNEQYFNKLTQMEQLLSNIDRQINSGYQRLSDALWLNSNEIQMITGNYLFDSIKIMEHNSNGYTALPHRAYIPNHFNIITNYLNGIDVKNLFAETIGIQNGMIIKVQQTLHFNTIDLTRSKAALDLHGLVNNVYNMSDIVTSNVHRVITGKKRFHNCLLVDEKIVSDRVNGKLFNSDSVLLTTADQIVRNPVRMHDKLVRTNALDAKLVNNIDISHLFSNMVHKNEPVRITMPVKFANGLNVYNLLIDASGRLNGHDVNSLQDSVLWTNRPNQKLEGDFFFESNVTIRGNLFVDRINNKNIPEDLILAKNVNIIEGKKIFKDPVYVHRLNVTNELNGLKVFQNGMPDILLKYWPQSILGRKVLHSLHIKNHSHVGGLVNRLSIQELDRQSKIRPQMQHFDQIIVDNYANFQSGLNFDKMNSLSRLQFDRLIHESLTLNEQWTNLEFDRVYFDQLELGVLDCETINGLNLEHHLLTRSTSQTVSGFFAFQDVVLEQPTSVQSINNFSLSNLDNLFLNHGNQFVSGMKVFVGDIYAHSLRTPWINNVPFEDIVFMDNGQAPVRLITGPKYFKSDQLQFDLLTVTNMNVKSINNVDMANMLTNSLRHKAAQTIPSNFGFKSMLILGGEDFRSLSINSVDLMQLWNDAVFSDQTGQLQNVTANKLFTGRVSFGAIEFDQSFDGVTFWEMKNNWMVQNVTQKVSANFSVDSLQAHSIHIHDSKLNGIDLNWLENNVVRRDRKTIIRSNLEFFGRAQINGQITLHGKINEIDLNDIVMLNSDQIQTLRGKIELMNNVSVVHNLDVNGFVNGINVGTMCARAYRPVEGKPLVINGHVRMFAPVKFDMINSISYHDLRYKTVRHDLKQQQITGKKMINTLVLNGPVQLNRHINNLNLEYIFQNYMSITMDQIVESKIILQNNQIFDGDLLVNGNFFTENGIIGGVNVAQIDQHALRIYGDQLYEGDINFQAGLDIDLSLNSKYVNGFEMDSLMNRKRQSNVFTEETVFTRNLNVKGNLNIINGKRIDGARIDEIYGDAVLRNSNQNYTITGKKTFDAVNVNIIHTRPLNDVVFSRENLLLKNHDQVVTGEMHFDDELIVNTSIVVNTINDIQINKLNNRLVKKSKPNVIKTKVRIRELNVNVVKVKALIDNVNISILNTISDRVKIMESLQGRAQTTKTLFDMFENQLSTISAKLLFYDSYLMVREQNLDIDYLRKPLLVSLVDNRLFLFMSIGMSSGCNQVAVFTRPIFTNSTGIEWYRSYTLYSPGPPISMQQSGHDQFILLSHLSKSTPEHIRNCLSQNVNSQSKFEAKGTVLLQMYRLITKSSSLIQINYVSYQTTFSKVQFVSLFSHNVLIGSDREYTIFVTNGPPLSSPPLDGRITKVYNFKDTLVVETIKNGLGSSRYEQNIIRYQHQSINVQKIPLLSASNCLIIESGLADRARINYQRYLLIAETTISQNGPAVHVYGYPWNSTLCQKIQTIEENQVQRMESILMQSGTDLNPYVLMHKPYEIVIYRLLGLSGFHRYGRIRTNNGQSPIRSMFVTGDDARYHYLALYFGDHCQSDDGSYQAEQSSSLLQILKPRFRREMLVGSQMKVNDLRIDHRDNSQIVTSTSTE